MWGMDRVEGRVRGEERGGGRGRYAFRGIEGRGVDTRGERGWEFGGGWGVRVDILELEEK